MQRFEVIRRPDLVRNLSIGYRRFGVGRRSFAATHETIPLEESAFVTLRNGSRRKSRDGRMRAGQHSTDRRRSVLFRSAHQWPSGEHVSHRLAELGKQSGGGPRLPRRCESGPAYAPVRFWPTFRQISLLSADGAGVYTTQPYWEVNFGRGRPLIGAEMRRVRTATSTSGRRIRSGSRIGACCWLFVGRTPAGEV